MPQLNTMYWNLGGLDQQRAARVGASLPRMIASVMRAGGIGLAGFSGVLGGLGGPLGQLVVDELRGHDGTATWIHQASPPLGQGRDEQYLFVWNGSAAGAYKPPGLEFWLWEYPAPQGGLLGFPRPAAQSPDLPPFTMFFRLGGGPKWLPVSLLHAPPWQGAWVNGAEIAQAVANLTLVEAFDKGNGALLMGTFNVPADDNVNVPGSNGALTFGTLAGQGGKYTQAMNNHRTALGHAIVAASETDAFAQTSDNFFWRRNGAQGGVGMSNPGILGVISGSLGSLDDQGNWQSARFRPALAAVEATAQHGDSTAGPDGSYDRFYDAFAAYRLHVSDHAPISITIDY